MISRKKRVELHGSLEYPLEIGYAAFIKKLDGDPIRTSAVKHFITLPSGTVRTDQGKATVSSGTGIFQEAVLPE